MSGAAAASAAVVAAMIQAVKASGVLVRVEPEAFNRIASKVKDPLIIRRAPKLFSPSYHYLTSYKGFAFYTKSPKEMPLPAGAEVVEVQSIFVPS